MSLPIHALASVLVMTACSSDNAIPVTPGNPNDPDAATPQKTSDTGTHNPSTGDSSTAYRCTGNATIPPVSKLATGAWQDVSESLKAVANGCTYISVVKANPLADQLIVGLGTAGMAASTDGGKSWASLGTEAGSLATVPQTQPSEVTLDPMNAGSFWVATIYNQGVTYSTKDSGVTFSQLGDLWHTDAISVDFTDPERKTLVAGHHERQQLSKSVNGGQTWTDITASFPTGTEFTSYALVIDANTYLIDASGNYSSAALIPGIFRTTDGGSSWKKVFDGRPNQAVRAGGPLWACDGTIYWATDGGGLASSSDNGASFQQPVPDGTLVAARPIELPDRRLVALGSNGLVRSSDQGKNWSTFTPAPDPMPGFGYRGVTYSPHERAFFIWDGACPTEAKAIQRFDFDYAKN